jgi:hypothetical protein
VSPSGGGRGRNVLIAFSLYCFHMLKKSFLIFLIIASSVTGIIFLGCSASSSNRSPISIEKKTGASGLSDYIIIYKNSAKIDFEITRPDVKDSNILLCIAGAFTTLDKYGIDGLYICNGKEETKLITGLAEVFR